MKNHITVPRFTLTALAVGLLLSGCSLAPVYHAPVVVISSDAWQDNLWQLASPADALSHGSWWQLFNDPVLDKLETGIDAANPGLAAALARYDQANAYTSQLQAGLGPTVDAGAALATNRESQSRPLRGANLPNVYQANTVGLTASYGLDIWGKVRNMVQAGQDTAQASAADLESLRLALHATLADNYVSLRAIDTQLQIVSEAIAAYTRALDLTVRRHDGGVASGIDVSRARTELSSARSQAADLLGQRAQFEHAIASLLGQPAMNYRLAASAQIMALPIIPLSLPSQLLLRRPDIAAAERRTAAANANIGVARAAYYPNFSLSANYGVQNTGAANLFSVPNTFWSLGPGALMNVFDYGKHDAELAQARAALEAASADYRVVVLSAFEQVADDLSRLKYARQSALDQQQAQAAAETTLVLALNRYREGAVNYLEVVLAQQAALAATRRSLDIHTQALRSSVDLIRALGGGWTAASLPVAQP